MSEEKWWATLQTISEDDYADELFRESVTEIAREELERSATKTGHSLDMSTCITEWSDPYLFVDEEGIVHDDIMMRNARTKAVIVKQ